MATVNAGGLGLFGTLLLMYGPVLHDLLNNGLWSSSEHGHGPIVLAVSLWLLWQRWNGKLPNNVFIRRQLDAARLP